MMNTTDAGTNSAIDAPCPRWIARVPGYAFRWVAILGCGAFWTVAIRVVAL